MDGPAFALLYPSAALATLAKGLPGIVLPGLVAFVEVARRRAWRDLVRYRIPTGTLVVVDDGPKVEPVPDEEVVAAATGSESGRADIRRWSR